MSANDCRLGAITSRVKFQTNATVLQAHHRVANENKMNAKAFVVGSVKPIIAYQFASYWLILHLDPKRIVPVTITLQRCMVRIDGVHTIIGVAYLLCDYPSTLCQNVGIVVFLHPVCMYRKLTNCTERQVITVFVEYGRW